MKILVTGANGMLAKEVKERFGKENEIIATDVAELDITNEKAVMDYIMNLKPEYIINCAAYTAVDKAEENYELADKINGDGPANLAKAAKSAGAKLVHISTDYVFGGELDVSKDYIEPDRIEVKLHNVTDIARKGEFSKLTYKEKECVIGLVSSIINELAKQGNVSKEELSKMPVDRLVIMLNKNIFISPEENIVILCTENEPTKDEIMAVTKNSDGKYELENLKIDNKEKEICGQAGDDVQKENDNKENESELENEKEKGTSMRKKAPWERRMAS